ncbi:MAG: InlB B-repeat-containing protein, partial [Lachnospiraceae bacterium]|nr:InlB B-repeat-containing protein [Lachnospiraceae bacterium]
EKAIAIPVSFNGNSKDYNCGNVSATKLDLSFQVSPYDGIDLSNQVDEVIEITFEKDKLDNALNKFVISNEKLWNTELYINAFVSLDGFFDGENELKTVDFPSYSFRISKEGADYCLNALNDLNDEKNYYDIFIDNSTVENKTVTFLLDFPILENGDFNTKYSPEKMRLSFDFYSNNFIYDGSVTINRLALRAFDVSNKNVAWSINDLSSISYNKAESKLYKHQFDNTNHKKLENEGDLPGGWYSIEKSFDQNYNTEGSFTISANNIFFNDDFKDGGYLQNSFTLDGNFKNDENNKYSMDTLSGSTIEEEIILPNELFENGNFPEDASMDFYTNLSFFNQDNYWVRLEKENGNPVLNYYTRENDNEVKVDGSKASSLGQLVITNKNNYKILHIELPVGIPFNENIEDNNININTRIEGDCIQYQGNFFCSGFCLKKGQECFAEYYPNKYLPIAPTKNISSLGTRHNFGNAKTNPGVIYEIYDNASLETIDDGTTILKGMPVVFDKENSLIENMNGCTTQFQPNNESISTNNLASLNIRIPKELMDLYGKDGIRIQPYVNYATNVSENKWINPNCDKITVLTKQNGEIVAQVFKDCDFAAGGNYNKKSHLIATNTVSFNEADSYYDVSVSTNVIYNDQNLDTEDIEIIGFDCNVVPVYTSESVQSMFYVSEYSLKDSLNHEYLTNVKESFSKYNFCDRQSINTFFTNYAFGKSQYQNIYTINYELNDTEDSKAINPSENITKYNENVVFELKEPSRTGYTFEGWYSDAELLTPVSILKNQDATVYASWKKINNNLQVSFVNSTQSPVYTGSFIRPAVIVTTTVNTKKVTLKQNSDYTVSYKNNREVGTAQVIITGINGYEGSISKSFSITPASISSNEIKVSDIGTVSYNKASCTPEPTIYYYGYPLVKDKDYELSYANNTTSGNNATIHIKGIKNFSGTKDVFFTIESNSSKLDIGLGSFQLDTNTQKLLNKTYTFTGKEQKPNIKSLSLNGKKLSVNKQYKLVYENNIHAGTATVKAIGIGDYIGIGTIRSFPIKPRLITAAKITVPATVSYTGKAISNIPVVVTDGKNVLREGEDYQVTFKPLVSTLFDRWMGNTRVSIAVTAIEGNGHDYVNKYYKKKGISMVKPFTKNIYIAKCNLNSKTATVKMSVVESDGKPVSSLDEECVPMVQVTYNDTVLENGMKKDYILSYKINSKKKTVTITAKATSDGNYKGKIVRTFPLIDTGEEDD